MPPSLLLLSLAYAYSSYTNFICLKPLDVVVVTESTTCLFSNADDGFARFIYLE